MPRFPACLAMLALSVAGAPISPATAEDGDFDTTFHGSGMLTIEGGLGLVATTVIPAPDGRLVVVGAEITPGGGRDGVWYAVANDTVSPVCRLTPPSGSNTVELRDAIFDAAGRLLLVGDFDPAGGERLLLARYLYPACALDSTFDGNGLLDHNLPSGPLGEFARAVALHPTAGWIAVTGDVDLSPGGSVTAAFVALFTADGVPITAFDDDGWIAIHPTGAATDISLGVGIAFSPANRIVVAGQADHDGGTNTDIFVARLDLSGDLDPEFGVGGVARVAFDLVTDGFDGLEALAIDPRSGAAVLAGEIDDADGSRIGVARLTPEGDLDRSFAGDGRWYGNPCATDDTGASGLAIDGLGRPVASGYCANPGGTIFFALRLSAAGVVDPAFSDNGWAQIPFGDGDYQIATDVTLASGRVAFAGTFGADFGDPALALARLESSLLFADGFETSIYGSWSAVVGGS